jgi:hypothetical protein
MAETPRQKLESDSEDRSKKLTNGAVAPEQPKVRVIAATLELSALETFLVRV